MKHLYLGMFLAMSDVGLCSITMSMFIAKDVELGSVVAPASGTFLIINESIPLVDEAHRKRFHCKAAQLVYISKRIGMVILTAAAFLTTRVSAATKEDDGKLLRELKYLRGTQEIGLVLNGRQRITLEVFADALHAVHDGANGHGGAIARIGDESS